jgi:hypothetical protein
VTHGVLVELAGIDRADLRKSLKRLSELGVIDYRAGAGKRFSIVALSRAGAPPLEQEEGGSAPGCNLPVVEGSVPPSEGGGSALGEQGGSALDERNGLPERTTERTQGVADATPWRAPLDRVAREHVEASPPSSWFEQARVRVERSIAGDDPSDREPTLDEAVQDLVLFRHYVAPYAELVDDPGPSS